MCIACLSFVFLCLKKWFEVAPSSATKKDHRLGQTGALERDETNKKGAPRARRKKQEIFTSMLMPQTQICIVRFLRWLVQKCICSELYLFRIAFGHSSLSLVRHLLAPKGVRMSVEAAHCLYPSLVSLIRVCLYAGRRASQPRSSRPYSASSV